MTTTSPTIVPVTFCLERRLDHGPEVVFAAYADIEQRARWFAPGDEVLVLESCDFRPGGTDHYLRGPRDAPSAAGTNRYELIVENECIVFTERLVDIDDRLLTVSLTAWRISPVDGGSLLTIVDEKISVAGSGPIEGVKYGYELMLDRLAAHLRTGSAGLA